MSYYENNKEERREYSRNYYHTIVDKDKCQEKNSKKITCECGSIFRYGDKQRHLKTKKHLDFNNNIEKKIYDAKENITCHCGSIVQKGNLKRHQDNGCKKPNFFVFS